MSTDIIRFPTLDSGQPKKTFSLAALQLFMTISLPLMFLSFFAWWIVYRWVNRKDKLRFKGLISEV